MKFKQRLVTGLVLASAALALFAPHANARQQDDEPLIESRREKKEEPAAQAGKAERQRRATPADPSGERPEPAAATGAQTSPAETGRTRKGRTEAAEEDVEGLTPYYNNFMTSYRLGPEDVISIKVFGLERYDKLNIVVPPDGRVDYYFIKGGLQVTGKTRSEVEEEITRHLDEYIIDPKVTVSLEKAMSARFGVIGDVARPGIMVMTRRLSVYEALNEAGGVLQTGDKKKVVVLRWNEDRIMERQVIDVAAIEKGKMADNYFLRPGDQVFVPGNRYKTVKEVLNLLPVISFARIFTGGF
jgi:polysaccharide export outer membrane protein